MKRFGNNAHQALINEIVLETNGENFKKIFSKINNSNKTKFMEIILQNNLSSNFINFIGKNNFYNLIDENFLNKCEHQKKRFQINSLNIISEVHKLVEIFENNKLNPIFLKGLALQREYDDIALRPFVDIDILFEKSDLLKAYQVLYDNDFLDSTEKPYLNSENINHFCKSFHNIKLVTKNNIVIELHHRITPNRFFDECPIENKFKNDLRKCDFFGTKINFPSINNLLLHQLCHFFMSDFRGLIRTLNDIRVVMKNHNINFYEIVSKQRNKKIRKSLILSLEVINYNNIVIESLDQIRSVYSNDSPNDEIILEAQTRLFDTKKRIEGENLYKNMSNPKKGFNILMKKIFPSRNSLIYHYKISKPNKIIILKTYFRHLFKQFFKLKNFPGYFFKNNKKDTDLKYTNTINLWFNRN